MSEMKPVVLSNLERFVANLKQKYVQLKNAVLSVNGVLPDSDGDIGIDRVDFAGDLESSSTQVNIGEYIMRTSGGEASIGNGDAWLNTIRGNSVHTGFVAEELNMTVNAMERAEPITAEINEATFKSVVTESGTTTLTYTTEWSADPATYGITVTGTPVAGDQIVVVYVKEVRGTIKVANPSIFMSTGWNLYNHTLGYARVLKYSDTYGFKIAGAYTALKFSATLIDTPTAITVNDGNFTIPSDGYVWVTGGDSSTTAIWMTWDDWTEGYNWDGSQQGSFAAYSYDSIDLSSLFGEGNPLPYGLLKVGSAYDEINLNIGQVISRVDRMAYSAENRATAESSGREYDFDENYIYIVRANPVVTTGITILGSYSVNDHGMEMFDSDVPVVAQSIYGASLKNKLERNVLTLSQQSLTSGQKAQVLQNIGAASAAALGIVGSVASRLESETAYIASNTNSHLSSIVLDKGVYIVQGVASFGASGTGLRQLWFSFTRGGTIINRFCIAQNSPTSSGFITRLAVMSIIEIGADNTTLYLAGFQSSGGLLSVEGIGIQVVRLK